MSPVAFRRSVSRLLLCIAVSYAPVCTSRAAAQAASAPAPVDRFEIPANDEGLPGVGPLRRHTWFRTLWRDKRSTWASQRQQDQGAVVFLGDSITQGWNERLATEFPAMKVANRGISGDTSRGVLIRLDEDVLSLKPKAVVLLIGTNDLEEGARPDVIEHNVRLILSALRNHDHRMPVVLCQVFPSSAKMRRPSTLITDVNARLMALVKYDPQVVPVETYALWADAEGDAPIAEFPDLLHLNDAGYRRWASALRPVFETLGLLTPPVEPFTPEPGFESLFNGRDLTGWGYRPTTEAEKAAAARWQASDPNAALWPVVSEPSTFDGLAASPDGRFRVVGDRIVVTAPAEFRKIQELWTTREFGEDFVLKLEFRAMPNADSGVYLRGPQLQVRDYRLAGPFTTLEKYRPQDWNELVVTVRGGVPEVTCNGERLEVKLALPATGPIGLEGDRGQMEYRRIRIGRPTP
jgi:lysophospholipase L1-like esterase